MTNKLTLTALSILAITLAGCSGQDAAQTDLPPVVNPDQLDVTLPDFSDIPDVSMKKQQFFEFMLPVIREENEHLLVLRDTVEQIFNRLDSGEDLLEIERLWLNKLAGEFDLETTCETLSADCRQALLRRIDIIPPSLILAQAANESAWGTSRFATEGNNLFGQWCFSKGCGIVPLQQADGPHYEVKAFETVQGSVRGYLMNLNTHRSYRELRRIRAELRASEKPVTGVPLARGLGSYSIRGQEYVEEIRNMIRFNRLERYDPRPESVS